MWDAAKSGKCVCRRNAEKCATLCVAPHPYYTYPPLYDHGQRGSLTLSVALSAFLCFCTHIPLLSQGVFESGGGEVEQRRRRKDERGVKCSRGVGGPHRVLHTFRRFACTRTFRFWRRPTFQFRPCCAGAAT